MDLILIGNVNEAVKRIDAGLIAPLNEFLDEEGIDIHEVYNYNQDSK